MAKARLRLVTPATVKRTVTPRRLPNKDLRTCEHLTEAEMERLMKAASSNRYGHRDATMVLVAYRHGLRVSELVDLRCGIRWTSEPAPCTFVGSSRALPALILLWGTNYVPYGGFSVSKIPSRRSCSRRNAAHHSRLRALHAWSSERARRLIISSPSRRTRTCLGTPAATHSRTRDTTRGRYKRISDTATSSTRCAMRRCRRCNSRTSGATEARPLQPARRGVLGGVDQVDGDGGATAMTKSPGTALGCTHCPGIPPERVMTTALVWRSCARYPRPS